MKLTQKAVAALTLPTGKTDHFEWDDEHSRFRLPVARRCWRQDQSHMDRAVPSWRCHPSHEPTGRGARRRAGARLAKKALGKVANGEDPQASTSSIGAARTNIRSRPPSPIILAIKQREVRPRTYSELTRYLTDKRYFGPLHSLALDQISRKDVAARLNRISLESSSIVALRARAQLSALFAWAMQAGPRRSQPGGRHRQAEGQPAARARVVGRRAFPHLEGVR